MFKIGRFTIAGSWELAAVRNDELRIIMPPPRHLCGCGWEPYTQAALLAIPDHITPGCSFADIGAGTGIISVAAKLLGASRVFACEINPEALEFMPQMFQANATEVEIVHGSLPPEAVDVALVSISDQFVKDNSTQLHALARKLLVVRDDPFTVEVIRAS